MQTAWSESYSVSKLAGVALDQGTGAYVYLLPHKGVGLLEKLSKLS